MLHSLFTKNQIKNITRLHFWSEDKSCYVVTNNVLKATERMKDEYTHVSIATSQLPTGNMSDFVNALSNLDIQLKY